MSYDDYISREPDPGADDVGSQPMLPPTPRCRCGACVTKAPGGWWMPFCAACAAKKKAQQTNASDC